MSNWVDVVFIQTCAVLKHIEPSLLHNSIIRMNSLTVQILITYLLISTSLAWSSHFLIFTELRLLHNSIIRMNSLTVQILITYLLISTSLAWSSYFLIFTSLAISSYDVMIWRVMWILGDNSRYDDRASDIHITFIIWYGKWCEYYEIDMMTEQVRISVDISRYDEHVM